MVISGKGFGASHQMAGRLVIWDDSIKNYKESETITNLYTLFRS